MEHRKSRSGRVKNAASEACMLESETGGLWSEISEWKENSCQQAMGACTIILSPEEKPQC